jgi:L-glyceraldehyde 3-phosphate reductase
MPHLPKEARYQSMTYTRCGKSGLRLPRIALGLWQNFGANDSPQTAREMVLGAFDLGVTHFDLANNYGPPPGSAEDAMGQLLRTELKPYRDELVISTKAGYDMWPGPYGDYGSRKHLLASLDQSLRRLGLDYVDIFYHHRPDPETPLEESMGALAQAVHSGKALYVGISNYTTEQTLRAVHELNRLGVKCTIHQPSYSIFNRWVEPELLATLEREGVGGIVFSPLAQGLLTNRYLNDVPRDSRAIKSGSFLSSKDLTETRMRQIRALNEVAAARGQSLAQLALNWVLRQPAVTSALVGASRLSQLADSVGALSYPSLSLEEMAKVDEIVML